MRWLLSRGHRQLWHHADTVSLATLRLPLRKTPFFFGLSLKPAGCLKQVQVISMQLPHSSNFCLSRTWARRLWLQSWGPRQLAPLCCPDPSYASQPKTLPCRQATLSPLSPCMA